jgi:citrate lyase subunit beta/citryl-CoA lyase
MAGGFAGAGGFADLTTGRTWLFVPGDRPERFAKAVATGADVVICDLEDAISADAKAAARSAVAQWLQSGDGSAVVRINPPGTPWHDADVAALRGAPGLRAVMLPKSQDTAVVADVAAALRVDGRETPIIALVESALGVLRSADIAALSCVTRLAFGALDYALDVGADAENESALLLARTTLVLCSRAAGAPGPIDGVTTALDDDARLLADTATSRALGFTGKLCVHPRQVPLIHQGFAPTAEQIAWARTILEVASASTVGAARTAAGALVDRPVITRAEAIMAAVGTAGQGEIGNGG